MIRQVRSVLAPFVRDTVLGLPRRLTASQRVLPDFLVIGAMKAGTTSLHHAIEQHPQVRGAALKGVHYFDSRLHLGEAWYRAQFPRQADLAVAAARLGRPILTGEASPSYLVYPHAPGAIHALLPGARLVAVVRDPVKRAYSHYNHNLRKGEQYGRVRETLSFADALAAEEERLAGEAERLAADPSYRSPAFSMYSYKTRGRYAEQLDRYGALFPREQLLVVTSEAFYRDTQAVMDTVFRFLGLDPWVVPNTDARNAYEYRAAPMDDATRDTLGAYFAPHNRRLADDWLGADPGWTGG